jgi:hypothetical protein
MSLIVRNNDYAISLPPKGKHVARCFSIIDLGIQKNKNYGSHSPKVLIAWELSHSLMSNERPFTIMQRYTANLNPQSRLRALLEAWRGRAFELNELHEFHLENMLTEPCYLTIEHIASQDQQKYLSKIKDIAPFPSLLPCPNLYNIPISFDLDYYTEKSYLLVSEHIRKKVNLDSKIH